MGFTFNVGPECEFFLFQTDDEGYPTTTTIDHGSYFELGPVDRGEDARRDICLTLEDMGFEIELPIMNALRGSTKLILNTATR